MVYNGGHLTESRFSSQTSHVDVCIAGSHLEKVKLGTSAAVKMAAAGHSQDGTDEADSPREQRQTTFHNEHLPIDRGWAYVIMFGNQLLFFCLSIPCL